MDVPRFAIFYADGSIVEGGGPDDETVEIKFEVSKKWLDAPNDEVQAVVVENPYTCRYVWRGQDFYFVLPTDDHEIHCADDLQPYTRKYFKGIIKSGVCMGTKEYAEMWKAVNAYQNITSNCEHSPRPDEDEPRPPRKI